MTSAQSGPWKCVLRVVSGLFAAGWYKRNNVQRQTGLQDGTTILAAYDGKEHSVISVRQHVSGHVWQGVNGSLFGCLNIRKYEALLIAMEDIFVGCVYIEPRHRIPDNQQR